VCLTLWQFKVIKDAYITQGSSWSWSYGSWIYSYICKRCEFEYRSGMVLYSIQHYMIKFVSDLR